MKHIVCNNCGQRLLKANDGSQIEINCPRCNEKIVIAIKDKTILVTTITQDKKGVT